MLAAHVEGVERANRPPKKAGWAKAAPRFEHPKKGFTPRARPGAEGADDRPKRAFKPREDKIIGPKSATWARDADKARADKARGDKPRPGGPARPGGKPFSGKPGGSRGPSRG